jgi:lipopolysaccharide export system protein LptA
MRSLLAAALLVSCLAPARAEQADSTRPTEIEANSMKADDVRRLTIFDGNVVVTRGTMKVQADRIVVHQDADGFQHSTATGNPVRFRQKLDPKPPASEGGWMEGEARRIEIDDKTGKIELFDKARVNRAGDEVAGDYILVDQRADFYSVGPAKGESGRVRATLQPKAPAK